MKPQPTTQAKLYLPVAIDEKITKAVENRAAEKFGGFTSIDARGGWIDEQNELVDEPVNVLIVAGATEKWAKNTANWIAKRSDEQSVMWSVDKIALGFESDDRQE